jgi:DNA repair exonuclease SbcCD ATPase subunit
MTKPELQKELLEKVKEGIKPSDLKKKKASNKSDQIDQSIPEAPITPNQQIKNLQKEVSSLKKQLQTYKDFKEADLKIKENLKSEIEELKKIIEKSNTLITDKEQEITKYKENIKHLEAKIKKQDKTPTKNSINNKEETKETKTFFCDSCQLTKQGTFIKRKVDAPFEPRLHGRICYLCSSCSPYIKELNDTTFDKDNNPYKLY